jgi:hypothetical protein
MRPKEEVIDASVGGDFEALSRLIRYASKEAQAQGLELTSQVLNLAHLTMLDAELASVQLPAKAAAAQ